MATGIFVWLAGQLQATAAGADTAAKSESATAGKTIKQVSHDGKRSAQGKSEKAGTKSAVGKKSADVADAAGNAHALPAAVANSNAELTSAETSSAGAMANKAGATLMAATDKPAETPAAEPDVVAADQLNDVDRELQGQTSPSQPPQQTVAMAPLTAAPVLASSDSLDRTSLIGKVFIAFGALLTMASAARMLMA